MFIFDLVRSNRAGSHLATEVSCAYDLCLCNDVARNKHGNGSTSQVNLSVDMSVFSLMDAFATVFQTRF
jgi:hypothetical protein